MSRKLPQNCASMTELRHEIDALDTDLVALLAERAGYIDRAISLKQIEKLPARIDDRVAEVISSVRRLAQAKDLDADLAEKLWSTLIEWSIEREEAQLGK